MKKFIYTLLLLCVFTYAKAGDNKTVTLITSGQGKTQDEAKQNALRNAIEQAFGAFISSHTEVVNDNLVKDEIISISNGNIQKYEIISESVLPDNLGYTTTLKTIVSISKLTSFCESKGMQIEIKGSLFAFNVIQKELSALNEKKVLQELILIARNLAPKMFYYSIVSEEPVKNECKDYYGRQKNIKSFCIPLKVVVSINNNWAIYLDYLEKVLMGLQMSKSEIEDYKKMNLTFKSYKFFISKNKFKGKFKTEIRSKLKSDDEYVWNQLRLKLCDESAYDELNNSSYYSIYASGFEKSNYKIYNLNFRTDVKSILSKIYNLLIDEAFNYKIIKQDGTEIASNGFKVFFPPLSDEGGCKSYNRVITWACKYSITFIGYRYNDFNTRGEYNSYNILNDESIILQQIKPGATVGYNYCIPLFDLEEIKTLSNLEAKHK